MPFLQAKEILSSWAEGKLVNVRFSGGEPTLYTALPQLCDLAKTLGMKRIAVSTNGSADSALYDDLIGCGVNDFSISLDACCAEKGDKLAGNKKGAFDLVVKNIKRLAEKVYTTVGIVLTEENIASANDIIKFADSLSVSDIRIIPAAQEASALSDVQVDSSLLNKYPILRYRIKNMQGARTVRGLKETDSKSCGLVFDDMAVNQGFHFPCIIYMREGGLPIGRAAGTQEEIRAARAAWFWEHNTHEDPICKENCLDVCIDYNNMFEKLQIAG